MNYFSSILISMETSLNHEILIEMLNVQTGSNQLLLILNIFLLFNKTRYLNEEVNFTKPFPI